MGTAEAWTPLFLRAAQPSSQPLSPCPQAVGPGTPHRGWDTGRWQRARAGVASRSRSRPPRRGPSEAAPAPPAHGAAKGSSTKSPARPTPPRGDRKPLTAEEDGGDGRVNPVSLPRSAGAGGCRPRPARPRPRRAQPFVACPARRSHPARAAPGAAAPGSGSPAPRTFRSSLRMCTACSRLCSRMVAWISRSHPTRRT